jgi:hypothetical protein
VSDFKGTPGPWMANCFLVTASNGREVTHTGLLGRRHSSSTGVSGGEEDEANARLIAAAPDLLAACEAVLFLQRIDQTIGGKHVEYSLHPEAVRMLKEAIARLKSP